MRTRPATVAAIGNPYGGMELPAIASHGAWAVCGSRTDRFSFTRKRGALTHALSVQFLCLAASRLANLVCLGAHGADAPANKCRQPQSSPRSGSGSPRGV